MTDAERLAAALARALSTETYPPEWSDADVLSRHRHLLPVAEVMCEIISAEVERQVVARG